MTVAICLFCGSFKPGALTKCSKCGEIPSTKSERSDSVALTDHYHDGPTLERFSLEIKSGSLPSVDPAIATHLLQSMNSEVGQKIEGMFSSIKTSTLEDQVTTIPASDTQRAALIRELMVRYGGENAKLTGSAPPEASTFQIYPLEFMLATPQGLVFLVVERYLIARRANQPEVKVFHALHSQLTKTFKSDASWPDTPFSFNLAGYAKSFVNKLYGTGYVLTDEFIAYAVNRILRFYKASTPTTPLDKESSRSNVLSRQGNKALTVADNTQAIASRLVTLEAHNPGFVRMKHNPFMMDGAVILFKKMGYKKPLFTSQHQFVFNTVLSYVAPLAAILPTCIMAGPSNDQHLIQCWRGTGRFVGYQGTLELFDFSSSGKEGVPLIIEIRPFFDAISDLLDQPTV